MDSFLCSLCENLVVLIFLGIPFIAIFSTPKKNTADNHNILTNLYQKRDSDQKNCNAPAGIRTRVKSSGGF